MSRVAAFALASALLYPAAAFALASALLCPAAAFPQAKIINVVPGPDGTVRSQPAAALSLRVEGLTAKDGVIRGVATLTNNMDHPLRRAEVECLFSWSKGRRNLAAQTLYFYDIRARDSASQQLIAFGPTEFVDQSSCRVSQAN
jgi:hypothetical protein